MSEKKEIVKEEVELSNFSIPLPKAVVDEFSIHDNEDIELIVDNARLRVDFAENKRGAREYSLQIFLIPAFVSAIIFISYFLFQRIDQVPLTGGISIATFVSILGLISGLFCFTFYFVKGKKGKVEANSKHISWRSFPTIFLSFGIMLFILLAVFFRLIGLLFDGVTFDIWTSTVLVLVFISVIDYAMIHVAHSITTKFMMTLLIVMILGGVLFAMATNSEYRWWEHNFSFLGTPEAARAWEFNITLMLSALLMIALIDFLFVTLNTKIEKTKKLMILRILLILTAINFGFVGLFPYNESPVSQWLHNHSAGNLVYLIIILIITVRWLLPGVSKDFLKLSYIIGGILGLVTVLFLPVGYFSLTAFELIAFTLAFSWLFLLFKDIERIIEHASGHYPIQITNDKLKEETSAN